MVRNGWTSQDALDNIATVQAYLNSSAIGQPLEWTIQNPQKAQIGYQCAPGIGRCVGVDHDVTNTSVYKNSTCSRQCQALADDEWLALRQFWDIVPGTNVIQPNVPNTVLKKSIANSQVLPSNELLPVTQNTKALLLTNTTFDEYFLCRVGDQG